MGKGLDKFLLLMWKNLMVQWRHPIQTAIEILAPLIIALVLVVMRGLVTPEQRPAMLYTSFSVDRVAFEDERKIAYSPSSPVLETIMVDVVKRFPEAELIKCDDSKALELYLRNETDGQYHSYNKFVVGVQFDDSLNGAEKLVPHMDVTLRFPGEIDGFWTFKTDSLFPRNQAPGPRDSYANEGAYPQYYRSGFLALQQEVSYAIIKQFEESFDRTSVPILMQRFPYPRWFEDLLLEAVQFMFGSIIILSYLYTCISTVKAITTEKEKQLKETMKIMGLPSWLHWTAWFIKTLLMLFITLILMITLMTVRWYPGSNYAIFTHSNPLIVFLFGFLFSCATITFCFLISVFFSRANLAAIMAGVLWLLSFTPFSLSQSYYDSLSLVDKLAASLCSNSAMAFGFKIILQYEGIEAGIQWHNIWEPTSPDDDLVLGHLMMMLLMDTILYLIIALYVETVFPGEFGVPQKWYFPVMPSYWCGNRKYVDNERLQQVPIENEYYEKEPTELEVGVKINHLGKQFSKKNVAVKDLTINLYKDQITVLLGHNGAGKTTTMSMLSGMFPPTSGSAIVGGYDIRTQMPAVRDSLGLCPQHNILFDDLTVREHLYFYSRLKGLDKAEINAEISKFLQLLEFNDKGDVKSATLSGGMKRKLSVAIALCGGSSIVMCDEPSSGMDPSARRALWDLLQSQKKGRTILLTTHFMDEADLLGDRIAIMANGKLQCCGTSYFLKKKYGAGYHLIMDVAPTCNIEQVTRLIQKYIPDVQVESNIGSELSYTLDEEHSGVFQEMLHDLETQSANLGTLSYGISLTSFDEVFMKVNAKHTDKNGNDGVQQDIEASHVPNNLNETKLDLGSNLLTGWALWCNQVLAMFMKRGLTILRAWFLLLLQIVIPVAYIVLVVIINRIVVIKEDLPSLKIDLGPYTDPVTVLARDMDNKYAQKYIDILNSDNGRLIDWGDDSVFQKMLVETREKLSEVRVRYMTGATFWENNTITAWFNNNPFHTPPLALQMVMNAILQHEVSPNHYIQIFNHPLPFSEHAKNKSQNGPDIMRFTLTFILGLAMAFVSAFYIMFYVKERVSNAKQLQFVSGVRVVLFWGSSFICDLLTFTFISICIVATFAALQEEGWTTADELARLFSVLFHFGFSVLPLMYLASFLATVPATAYAKIAFLNTIAGVAPFLIIYFAESVLKHYHLYFFHYIFLLVPLYSFCVGIGDLGKNHALHKKCDGWPFQNCEHDCCDIKSYYSFEQPGIGTTVLYAYFVGILLFLLLLGIEYRVFKRIKYATRKSHPSTMNTAPFQVDDDVQREKEMIKNAPIDELKKHDLVLRNVTKYYKKLLAVNDLCLGVNRYECFGLLGVNGAGKTTTFKMMTGEIGVSDGDGWVKALNLKTDMKQIHQLIGYCPQFDALLDNLTCRETIIMFSLIRGLTISEGKHMVEKLARDFDFYPHLHKKIKHLSGGNKRKLSTAITLIGDPLILFLDEPTTGMDPATKRYLWKALCKVRDSGKCIVLTSHNMEECEALCTRIAIMVNGGFVCLGSTQHLKSKFSEGYTLTMRLRKTDDLEPIVRFVQDNFHNAIMRENHLELVTFYIADRTKPWSQLFGIMEQGKRTLNIEDYSLGQSSLEQVFLSFTKYQRY